MTLNKKQKKQLDVDQKKLSQLQQQLSGAKKQVDDPDDVARSAESLAKQMHIPRSRLYIKAIREFVRKHRDEAITASLNEVYSQDLESDDEKKFRRLAAKQVLERAEW